MRNETSPEDVHGMMVSQGILTARGGLGQPRRRRRPWLGYAGHRRRRMRSRSTASSSRVGDIVVKQGRHHLARRHHRRGHARRDEARGRRAAGRVRTPSSTWADQVRKGKLGVRANADTGEDATNARKLGAEGIGLCRTEHMFLAPDRLPVVREMILADTPPRKRPRSPNSAACSRSTSRRSSKRWTGCPSPIRLLDPPLHEFLPSVEELRVKEATERSRRAGEARAEGRRELGRAQPDDRYPWRAPRCGQAGPVRDAGEGAARRGRVAAQAGQEPDRRGDDPAHRHPRGAGARPVVGAGRDRRCGEGHEEEAGRSRSAR